MKYTISVLRRAQKELAQLPSVAYEQIRDAIYELARDPKPMGCQKLSRRKGWRLRIGDYRIVYEIDNQKREVLILHIGHRRDVYRF